MTAPAVPAIEGVRALIEGKADPSSGINLSAITRAALEAIDAAGVEAALLPLWASCREAEDDPEVVRLASFLIARYTPDLEDDRWLPLLWLLAPPHGRDESTFQNILTALQRHGRLPPTALKVLRGEIGPALVEALNFTDGLVESVADVIFAYADADTLAQVLTKRDALTIRERLRFLAKAASPAVAKAAQLAATNLQGLPYAVEFPSVAEDIWRILDERLKPAVKGAWAPVLQRTDVAIREFLERYGALEELSAEAVLRNIPTQDLRITGRWASVGKLPIDFLEKVLHSWRRLYAGIRETLSDGAAPPDLFVLAPARGSFVVRILVETDQPDVDGKAAQALVEATNALNRHASPQSADDTKWERDLLPLLKLAAENSVDLELSLAVPGPRSTRHRFRVSHARAHVVVSALSVADVQVGAPEDRLGILDGANHRTGKFEMLPDDGGDAIVGTVSKSGRSILLDKTIGGSYTFKLRKVVDAAGGEDKWELHGLSSSGTEPIVLTTAREVLMPLPNVITSTVVPQVDSLKRITEVVEVVASGAVLSPQTIDLSPRHIAYHTHAARLLHLLSDTGVLSPAGAVLVALPEARRLEHLAIQFEVSVCGHAWLIWAGASSVNDLDPDSASKFLEERSDMGESMIERRGRTLRRWARDLQNRSTQ